MDWNQARNKKIIRLGKRLESKIDYDKYFHLTA